MACESEPILPLSAAEKKRVRENVQYLEERYKGRPDATDASEVLRAVDAAAEGKAPELPENLHPFLEMLRQQTQCDIARAYDSAEGRKRLIAAANRYVRA